MSPDARHLIVYPPVLPDGSGASGETASLVATSLATAVADHPNSDTEEVTGVNDSMGVVVPSATSRINNHLTTVLLSRNAQATTDKLVSVMTSSELVASATSSVLDDHPDLEEPLRQLVAIDEGGPWTFDDAPMDSGRFGELVARGVVEKDNGEYRLADRAAVEAVLDGEELVVADGDGGFDWDLSADVSIDRSAMVGLGLALAFVAAVRSVHLSDVFRDGRVVSPGNDPYFYRYWQRELLEISTSPFDLAPVTDIPARASTRPLAHAMNWWVSAVAGDADLVAALLPVVGAVVVGILLYAFVAVVIDDKRVGILAVVFLAFIPLHARYTALGFLEHRLHQYVWLAAVALALAWLGVDLQRRWAVDGIDTAWRDQLTSVRTWLVVAMLAVAISATAHSFRGSALLFIPIAGYVFVKGALDLHHGGRPLLGNVPMLVGLAAGAVLALGPYYAWGWHAQDFVLVLTPLLVAMGALGVLAIGGVLRHRGRGVGTYGLSGFGFVAAMVLAFRSLRPDDFARAQERAMDSFVGREVAAETMSLFSADTGLIFIPIQQIGLQFYVALLTLVLVTVVVARSYQPGLALAVVFAWVFIGLAAVQIRFAAQLSFYAALFAALGTLYALGVIGLVRRVSLGRAAPADDTPRDDTPPDSSTPALSFPASRINAGLIGLTIVLLLGTNLAVAPLLLDGAMYEGPEYEAMTAIEAHADELDRTADESAVLAFWDQERFYNFFVADAGDRYSRTAYPNHLNTSDPDEAYEAMSGSYGYLVTTPQEDVIGFTQYTLHEGLGLGGSPAQHYQLLYADEQVKAFALVPGAEVAISGVDNQTVDITTDVEVPGESFTYDTTIELDGGEAMVRVPYPGTYQVGNETVEVEPAAVEYGETVNVSVSDHP